MRSNEYNSLEDFAKEFVGEWSPSNGHWYGLDFLYHGHEYRLHTGSMYNETDTVLEDGSTALFGVYRKSNEKIQSGQDYILLGEYSNLTRLLDSCEIEGKKFKDVIMDDATLILGKD